MLNGLAVVNDEEEFKANPTVIKIIGCGGGGSSSVRRMIESGVSDVQFIVVNTDTQALRKSPEAAAKIAIGQKLTGGLGAGGNPQVGENAAKEDTDAINNIIEGANMVIITAGMGGGTGTGSAPVVAGLAKAAGALTVAVVTTPFDFEGPVRMQHALEGIKKLRENVDSLIVIPNEQVMKTESKKLNFREAFMLADEVVCQGVQGISEIITRPGEINLDFADVNSVMRNQGDALLGVGFGEGENRAVDAALGAISNPLLSDCRIDGATKILINVTSNGNLSMDEWAEINNNIKASASKNVEVFAGLVVNPDIGEKISVTVIATGFKNGIPEEFDVEETKAKKDDFVSADELKEILKPSRKSSSEEYETTETPGLTETIHLPKEESLLFTEFDKVEKFEKVENASVQKDDAIPSFEEQPFSLDFGETQGKNVDKNDLSIPAVLRRGIRFTDD